MVNVIRHKRITKKGVSSVNSHWRKKPTKHPLSAKEFSSNEYSDKDGNGVKVTNIMMETDKPYWVSGSLFPLKEFKTKKEAINYAKKEMKQ